MATTAIQANYDYANTNRQPKQNIRQVSEDDTVQIARNIVQQKHSDLLTHLNTVTDTAMQQVQDSTSREERKSILNDYINQCNALMTEIVGNNFNIMSSDDLKTVINSLYTLGDTASTSASSTVQSNTVATGHIGNADGACVMLIVMLSVSTLQAQIIGVDNQLYTMNQDATSNLNNALSAFTDLSSIVTFPVTLSDGTEIDDLFTLFEYVYATDSAGNPLNEAAQTYRSNLDPLKAQLDANFPTQMQDIESKNWGVLFYSLDPDMINTTLANEFAGCMSGYTSLVNQWIQQISPTDTQITLTISTISTDFGDYTGIALNNDLTTNLNNVMDELSTAIEDGNNASQTLYTEMQTDDTTYQQIYSIITSLLTTVSTIISRMWS